MVKIVKKFLNIYIQSALKNTIITVTTPDNNLLHQVSSKSAKVSFKTKKKNNPYIIKTITQKLSQQLMSKGYKYIILNYNGVGIGRYNVHKTFRQNKFKILQIHDRTKKPFNGCRLKKLKRR